MTKCKKYTLVLLITVFALFFGFGASALSTTTFAQETSSQKFEMVTGAEVRLESPSGIRFITSVDSEYKAALDTNYDYVWGTTLTFKPVNGVARTVDVDTKVWANEEETKWYTLLYDIPESDYLTEITAKSYVKKYEKTDTEKSNPVETTYVKNEQTRSIAFVASKALNDGKTDELLNGYVSTVDTTVEVKCDSAIIPTNGTLEMEMTETSGKNYGAVWTSSDESVATVDKEGNVKAVSAGTAIIKAAIGNNASTCSVTVTETPNISEIGINADPAKLTGEGIYADTTSEELAAYEATEKKGFSYTAVLREETNGGGMYVFAEARLDTLDLTQDKAFRLGVATTEAAGKTNTFSYYKNFYLTIGNAGQKSGFDIVAVRVVEKDKETDGYNYQVYYEGFVSYTTLEANNVSLNANGLTVSTWETHLKDYTGNIVMVGADYNASVTENAIKCVGSEQATTSTWEILPYTANAYFGYRATQVANSTHINNKLSVTTLGMQGVGKRGDVSKFAGKTSVNVSPQDTSDNRGAEFTMYYEKGVGVWFNFSAYRKSEPAEDISDTFKKGSFGVALTSSGLYNGSYHTKKAINFYERILYQANFTGNEYFGGMIYGTLGGGIYDVKNTVVWNEAITDSNDENVKYVVRAVGLIPESVLNEASVLDSENEGVSIFAVAYNFGTEYDDDSRLDKDLEMSDCIQVEEAYVNTEIIWGTNHEAKIIKVTAIGAKLVAVS